MMIIELFRLNQTKYPSIKDRAHPQYIGFTFQSHSLFTLIYFLAGLAKLSQMYCKKNTLNDIHDLGIFICIL